MMYFHGFAHSVERLKHLCAENWECLPRIQSNGAMVNSRYRQPRNSLQTIKEALEAELNAPIAHSETFKNAFPNGWSKYYDEAPNTAKNAAWRSVVRQITVDAENHIEVEFIPFR